MRERRPAAPKDLRDHVRRRLIESGESLWRMRRDLFGEDRLTVTPSESQLNGWDGKPLPLAALDAGEPVEVSVQMLPVPMRRTLTARWVRLEADNSLTQLYDVLIDDPVPTFVATSEDGEETITVEEARRRYPERMAKLDEQRRKRKDV